MFCCFKPYRSKDVKEEESPASRKAEQMKTKAASPFDQVPTPDPAKLDEHYILGEIIEHIEELHDDIHKKFPSIDLDILRDSTQQHQKPQCGPRATPSFILESISEDP